MPRPLANVQTRLPNLAHQTHNTPSHLSVTSPGAPAAPGRSGPKATRVCLSSGHLPLRPHVGLVDGRSLLDASAPPMVEPFVQVASASVSPSGASSPSDPHASATREYSDASAAPATEACPSNAHHTVSSVDDIPWRAHHTWPFGPQDHAILRPAQVPSSGPEETHTLSDAHHPSFVEDYNFDFTDPFGSADYGALVPGPSTAEILSTLTTRLDPSVPSNHSTLEFALGH
ncbi:hypothetical protein PHLGIDRAFT_460785 [Phlebiopsis gigantea 11061_1 CR5-6]|uniref:Uncharacterized protein n=1 Tax=Phlebiopsis gigantea (strain 11061_1 CR5-6) TaxID=745531 RepID=A0A0C3PJP3_PHLG1|nr:hypothetical protein PHLGIDRAFT_460785 [Phlebiopsis gigantea 11061_1 CR5-6]